MDCRRHDARQAACLLAAILLSSCGSGASNGLSSLSAATPPYPDTASKLLFGIHSTQAPERIYWLDNDRVLFPAYEIVTSSASTRADHLDATPPGIYIWNTSSGATERHANLTQHWWMCFNRGFLVYNTGEDLENRPTTFRAGPLGEEAEIARIEPWDHTPELKRCDGWPREEVRPEHPTSWAWSLAPDDGYIVVSEGTRPDEGLNETTQDQPIHFYAPGADAPIPLPIVRKEMPNGARLRYSEYGGTYTLIPWTWRANNYAKRGWSTWPKDLPIPVYSIGHGGMVNSTAIPAGAPPPSAAFPTKRGLFWVSNDVPSANMSDAGGWLLVEGKPQKLFNNLVVAAGVSPDGCKIAYAVRNADPRTNHVVHIMNLCAGERK